MSDLSKLVSRSWLIRAVRLLTGLADIQVVRRDGQRIPAVYSDQNVLLPLEVSETEDATGAFPFQITQTPISDTDWNFISVAPGYLTASPWPPVTLANNNLGRQLAASNYNTPIEVNDDDTYIAIFLDISDVNNVTVKARDSSDSANWKQFGISDDEHFVLGIVDTHTGNATSEIAITQLITASCWYPFGHIDNASAIVPGVAVVHGNYDVANTFSEMQSLVRGATGQGFPFDGLYVYTGSGFGVGPGNNWMLLAKD